MTEAATDPPYPHEQADDDPTTMRNPWHTAAIATVIDAFHLENPTIYYPGSADDASLTSLPGARVIHSDRYGGDALGQEGHEIHLETDAHTWQPGSPIDVVAFFNPTGLNVTEVVRASGLQPGGLVTWAGWSGLPDDLYESPHTEFMGVVLHTTEELVVDQTDADDYFTYKPYQALSDDEKTDFNAKLSAYLQRRQIALAEGTNPESFYDESLGVHEYLWELRQDIEFLPPRTRDAGYGVFVFRLLSPIEDEPEEPAEL